MNAREDILSAIGARRAKRTPSSPVYRAPVLDDPIQAFAERAGRANADVQFLESIHDVPQAIAELLRARNMPAVAHVPPSASQLPWHSAPSLTVENSVPGPDDAAVAVAPFGIAATGTLAYPSGPDAPASWHFRAGFEIAIVHAENVLPHMEDVFAQVKASGLPSTLNFVTGPSRTGDIEQTLELGAHGPKALAILIVKK